MTDDELVARARAGDAAAFDELVLRHQASVHRAALAATGSAADADDVGQDAFLLAYRRLRSFRGASSFKTWLLTITWNQAINRRRATRRWWRRIADAPPASDRNRPETGAPAPFCVGRTPENIAAAGELHRDIRRAIAALPFKLRDALLLVQSGEYSYEEMGAMLGAPAGTIKWRVSEARRAVKAALRVQGHLTGQDD